MAVRKIKGSWWVDFSIHGKRTRVKSPENTRAGAQAYEALSRNRLACGESILGAEDKDTPTFAAFSEKWFQAYVTRRDFFVYVDEFQSFTTLALVNMFSELRKYRVGFSVAHQYAHQLEPEIRHAVLGNAGTLVSFRVGAEDASYLVQEFHEQFKKLDFIQLPNYRIYVKLMIDGTPSKPFSAATLAPQLLSELTDLSENGSQARFIARER
jgi:hypothetical protein